MDAPGMPSDSKTPKKRRTCNCNGGEWLTSQSEVERKIRQEEEKIQNELDKNKKGKTNYLKEGKERRRKKGLKLKRNKKGSKRNMTKLWQNYMRCKKG
jgi:hypothetical protein